MILLISWSIYLEYNLGDSKPKSTTSEIKLDFPSDNYEVVDVPKYREVVESLVYAMVFH